MFTPCATNTLDVLASNPDVDKHSRKYRTSWPTCDIVTQQNHQLRCASHLTLIFVQTIFLRAASYYWLISKKMILECSAIDETYILMGELIIRGTEGSIRVLRIQNCEQHSNEFD